MHWLKHVELRFFLIFSVVSCGGLLLSLTSLGQQSSVLSTGVWYKLAIDQTGIYRIDGDVLREMGVDVNNLAPEQIRIFGNGGGMLPQANGAGYANPLIENAIWVQGQEDGKFDNNDAIYFYGEGPHVVSFDSVKMEFKHQMNCYTDTSYYFLNFGQKEGLRIKSQEILKPGGSKVVTEFTDYWFHEQETSNLLKSGREWWGEYLGGSAALNIQADIPGVIPSSVIKLKTSAIGAAQVPTKFTWQLNGKPAGESSIGTVSTNTYDIKGLRADAIFSLAADPAPGAVFSIGISYNKNGQNSAQAYLNYVALQVERQLKGYDSQQIYRFLPDVSDTVTFQFQGIAPDWHLWNVADNLKPVSVFENDVKVSSVSLTVGGGKKMGQYVGFTPAQCYTPVSWQRVDNQDIVKSKTPDLLIITPTAWESEARRLAAFRESNDGLETLVVTTQKIYNEYASGKPDVSAIRDFARDLFSRTPGKLKYLLLFGDAVFDYKDLSKNQSVSQRLNWVPVYESRESLNPVYTYSSDDYFGFMKTGDGMWTESTAGDHTLDIGVGRLPVKSLSEARVVVDKLIRYSSSSRTFGNWRNTVHFIADDGDDNVHQQHADQLSQMIEKEFLPSRIFLDAFPQTTTAEGQKAPGVNAAIRKSIDQGTLILNYTGHGGVSGWAEEQVLTLAEMQSVRGMDNLPLLFTATCDFGRYDDPSLVSGAEIMVLSPRGAAIGAISTTRPVYSSTNFTLSKAFYESLIKAPPGSRMGDIFRETKNKSLVGSLNRNFTLLADPSMLLARPENGIRWIETQDTLRALQKVRLEGEVYDKFSGRRDSIFNGVVNIAIYDKPLAFQTLGSENARESYREYRSKIFDGSATVVDGRFKSEFIVPKDIDYRIGTGRANVYAVTSDSIIDAAAQLDVVVGGSVAQQEDNMPPKLSAYLNDVSFKDGDVVSPSSVLFVKASDENGLSISKGGIGHDITLTINDTTTILLNDYYTSDLDDYRSGTIAFPFDHLPAGKYLVRVKIWDTHTNSSEIAFGFLVGAEIGIKLNALKIYPNPFDKDLSFELSHNRANEDVEIVFDILLNNGQLLGTFRKQYFNSEPTIQESMTALQPERWFSKGSLFVYRINIRSLKDNSTDRRSGQLVRSP
jgi:hypothetical protein